ncbi:wax ester/triacylglycerol synthase family O-acyltransferase [Rhodococcus ruber]|uniref:Diacylglycerol O-acyltransferase n=1 Tax=Rhodococcus ruber TaxID=1830 RepID=A0A098BIQ3_9NOCA|nr:MULTISPECIES: wax ester/triacylglycerol synthase family O-acyltransferase [Rhodococcus]ATQ27640.1 wax ester/triacylglycerol synthase family O-acyltransferase [Rhodococcus ruber]AUM15391.1 wax ester/triacylglycerol synthase family O-acyltransferase [Rhodococcus ruber]AXY52054.1 diacylglycerol O-acyltransferase [Rhodococcus ruber]MBD8056136.1 wax ester/triacylglycerol synthase family O-acyltransferase [Rhodococcus ruber]MBP2211430.1 WS/DGAT/MGAT family acyltransferase [Rhodococcus ruber]
MHRLSGLDAGFLYLETPTQLLHVCGLIVLDPTTIPDGYRFETLRAGLAVRLPAVPLFRQKIADSPFNLDHPVWVDDPDFDLDRHLHRVAVPAPGRREELAELCGHIAAQPLDRSRPLWEMTVIEGLEDGSVAVMTKIHHAGADGVTGAELVAQLCSLEPDAPRPDPVADGAGGGSALEIALGGLFNVATRPLGLVRALPKTVELLPRWISRARRGEAMPAPFTAPRTSFNGTITGHRSVGFTQFDLDRVKAVKDAHGVKVNDVVMAVCAGALRRYLTERDELPDSPLIGMVPVSVRGTSDRPGRNQVSPMFASLHTHITDPIERLHAIADANACAKEHNSALGASLLQDWTQFMAPAVFGTAMRMYASLRLAERHPVVHNLVVSNVPGPAAPLYFLGARIRGMYPLGPIFHGVGLNVTVMSLDGALDVGVLACPELVPDLWSLVDGFPAALEELETSR